ncbi:MAG: MlaD family protein, partial [Bacteroidales bacterium]
MKKLSREVKVGAAALITIIVFIWLYNFLKGKDLFSSNAKYYVVYNNVGGLAESSPVEVHGYQVGVVESVRFLDPLSGKLLVVLSVSKDFKIPRNSFAEITTATLIAGMKINFVYGQGPGIYSSGDTIPGRLAKSILVKLQDELTPVKDKLVAAVIDLDSTIRSINDIMDPEFRENIRRGVASLSSTVRSINEADLKSTLENINKFTAMLAENSGKMTQTFTNLETISDTLAASDVYNAINSLKTSLEKTAT